MSSVPFPTHSTPFPHYLIRQVMPTLKDTEWRVLCVIVDATLGWESGPRGRRKERDWLTQSQLMARTGRASAAVSQAVDGLVRRGLVEVQSEEGELLFTPEQRRRCRGRLFFRVSSRAQGRETSRSGHEARESRQRSSVSERGAVKDEVGKANTTREMDNKKFPYRGELPPGKRWGKPRAGEASVDESDARVARAVTREQPSEVRRFLTLYQDRFRQVSLRGDPPPIAWGKDGKLVKELLQIYPYERLTELLDQFFASDDRWIRERGYSLGAFRGAISQLLVQRRRIAPPSSSSRQGGWTKAGGTGSF